MVERSYITVDGNGHTLQGDGNGYGLHLDHLFNVTIKKANIKNFSYGIYLSSSSYTTISENNVTDSETGIYVYGSSRFNNISGNTITANENGVNVYWLPSNNTISGNKITYNDNIGIIVGTDGVGHTIFENEVSNNLGGILVSGISLYNNISRNNVENNRDYGIKLGYYNIVYGNTVRGNRWNGIHITKSYNNISYNEIASNGAGIFLDEKANYNDIRRNDISNNNGNGLYLHGSSGNIISGNIIANNQGKGIELRNSACSNIISENDIEHNSAGILVFAGNNYWPNRIYHNDFVDNTNEAITSDDYANYWTIERHGNYWSDYPGVDSNHDGIGDTPYVIAEGLEFTVVDSCPLMGRFYYELDTPPFEMGDTPVYIITNSTLEGFEYLEANSTIRFYVSSTSSTQLFGFCRVRIPKSLMAPPYAVIVNDGKTEILNFNETIYDTPYASVIYFAYRHSRHKIVVVPEFPSSLILPLFMIATLLAVIVYRKEQSKHYQEKYCARAQRKDACFLQRNYTLEIA